MYKGPVPQQATSPWEQNPTVVNVELNHDEIRGRMEDAIGDEVQGRLGPRNDRLLPFGTYPDEKAVGVIQGDIVFRKNDTRIRRRSGRDAFPGELVQVFSSLNGISYDETTLKYFCPWLSDNDIAEKNERYAHAVEQVFFSQNRILGVAGADQEFSATMARTKTGFPAVIGGIVSTRNSGNLDIVAMDPVVLSLPSPNSEHRRRSAMEGVPDNKVMPVLGPLNVNDIPSFENVFGLLKFSNDGTVDGRFLNRNMPRENTLLQSASAYECLRAWLLMFRHNYIMAEYGDILQPDALVGYANTAGGYLGQPAPRGGTVPFIAGQAAVADALGGFGAGAAGGALTAENLAEILMTSSLSSSVYLM